jgi:TetR/AcrR family transcriptional regulator, transcriptional repressor for nem operon
MVILVHVSPLRFSQLELPRWPYVYYGTTVPESGIVMTRRREFDEDKVLEAAMDAFWRHGFAGTSAQHLVEATGLGRGSLYGAYTSKAGLYRQAMQRYARKTRETSALLNGKGTIKVRVKNLLMTAVPSGRTAARQGCLMTNSAIELGHRAAVGGLVRRNFAILEQTLASAFATAQARGEIKRRLDAASLALFFVATLQGLRVLARVTPATQRRRLLTIINTSLNILE